MTSKLLKLTDCSCKRCEDYVTQRSALKKRAALLSQYKRRMKAFKPEDVVIHRDFKNRTGVVLARVSGSYFYLVRIGRQTYTAHPEKLYKKGG